MKLRLTLATAVLIAMNCAAQTPHESPEGFIRTLIKTEAADLPAKEYAQAGRRRGEGIYTPTLLALIREDRRRAGGEVGNLDFDPICACQDNEGLHLQTLTIVSTSSSTADAIATLRFIGPQDPKITYHLVLTPSGWRINDISTNDIPSLRKLLK